MFRNSRSARGEQPETDPRFLRQSGNLGVTRTNDFGSDADLIGANPEQVAKLIRCGNNQSLPWSLAVSCVLPPGASLATMQTGVLATGQVGNGGVNINVEFDCNPDTIISMPGPSIDLNAGWAPWLVCTPGTGDFIFQHPTNAFRPSSMKVKAIASLNQLPARGTASRSFFIDASGGAGGPYRLPIPPFAETLHVLCNAEADYAAITSVIFASGTGIVTYTGAQIAALKNAGLGLPVPGTALTANLVTGAALGRTYFSYSLSL